MTAYQIIFTAHLLPQSKPPDWPDTVANETVIETKDFLELKEKVDTVAWTMITQQGIIFMKDSNKPLGNNAETLARRVFVPFHMISFVETSIKSVVGSINNEGKMVN